MKRGKKSFLEKERDRKHDTTYEYVTKVHAICRGVVLLVFEKLSRELDTLRNMHPSILF